jgi:transcriptional regulator with GAF, ATPase, and Fis domain
MSDRSERGSGTWVVRRGGEPDAMRLRKCRLEVVAGPDAGMSVIVATPRIVVGRSGADLVLNDRKVSALHLEIRLEQDGYRLRDLGSTNGTFLWGLRVVEAFIGPGTTFAIGESAVRFVPLEDSVVLPLWGEARYCGLIGGSVPMRRMYDAIDRVAATDLTVLITGETGSGKELVAEALHERSARAAGPFVVLDCGAVPPQLFEDELFGHEEGAFTDASRTKIGVFEAADGGTLFLDEIGELPLDMQPKLLRAVETRRVRRVGGERTINCDVRLVAATNRDLAAEVNRRSFRSDLYFRVAVAPIQVPSLRERPDDIEPLVEHFLAELGPAGPLPEGFLEWARCHAWPGNVRELRHAVERAVITRRVPTAGEARRPAAALEIDPSVPFKEAKRRLVEEFDRRYLAALLEANDWNIARAARAAGVDRMSIYKAMQRLDIRRGGTTSS